MYGLPTSTPREGQYIVALARREERRYTHEQKESSVHERSDRHDTLILRRPCEFVLSAATASRLDACPVCCRTGLLKGLGEKMARPLAGRTGCRPAVGADLARPLAGPQAPAPPDPSAGRRANPGHPRSASGRLAPRARSGGH